MTDQPPRILHRTHATAELARPRIFECRVDVTGFLEGELPDWPPNIQDGIYAAMERLCKITKIKKLFMLQSRCGRDVPDEPYYVVVTVCEDKPREVIVNDIIVGK